MNFKEKTGENMSNDLENLLQLIDDIENIDIEECENNELISPFSSGKVPKPKRWKSDSLRHKLA